MATWRIVLDGDLDDLHFQSEANEVKSNIEYAKEMIKDEYSDEEIDSVDYNIYVLNGYEEEFVERGTISLK